jgi:hypothetical protein
MRPASRAQVSGGIHLWCILYRCRRRGAARARDRDQHEGRHQIAKSLYGRAKIIAPITATMVTFIARCFAVPRRKVAHGRFTEREFARLRVTVPARGAVTVAARPFARFLGFGAGPTFRAVTPCGGFGGQFFRRFGARGAVWAITAATFRPATPAITPIRPPRRATTASATFGGGQGFLNFGFRHRFQPFDIQQGDGFAGQFFDGGDIARIISGGDGIGMAFPPRAARAANAMHVIFRMEGHVEIEHMRQAADIKAARRHIGTDQKL